MFNSFIRGNTSNFNFDPELVALLADSQEEQYSFHEPNPHHEPRHSRTRPQNQYSPYQRDVVPSYCPTPLDNVFDHKMNIPSMPLTDSLPFVKPPIKPHPMNKVVSYRKPSVQHPEIEEITLTTVHVDAIPHLKVDAKSLYETCGMLMNIFV